MKLASREVHFILYTGPPVCQAPPERIFFLVQKVGGEDTRPLRRSGCGKSPVPGGLFPQPCIPLLFRPARAEKSSLCSPQPLTYKGCGGCDLIRGGLPPPRTPLSDPETSVPEKSFRKAECVSRSGRRTFVPLSAVPGASSFPLAFFLRPEYTRSRKHPSF